MVKHISGIHGDTTTRGCDMACDVCGPAACEIQAAVEVIGWDYVKALASRLQHARSEHPDNGGNEITSYDAICDEVEEAGDALHFEGDERYKDELLDVGATACRSWKEEWRSVAK